MSAVRIRRGAVAAAVATALLLAGCTSSGSSEGGADRTTTTTTPTATATSTTAGDAPSSTTGESTTTTTTADGEPGTEDPAGAPTDVEGIGTYAVGSTVVDLADTSRPTNANGSAPASEGRALPTNVWYPAIGEGDGPDGALLATEGAAMLDGRFPLVLFSHGVTGRGEDYGGNTRAWASAGYVVIAPDYPLSNRNAPGGPTVADVVNQPADASFLLDTFTDPEGPVASVVAHVDVERLAAVGHSLGAITTLGLAYGCCVDDRLDAAVSWAGASIGATSDADDDGAAGPPLLVVHGTEDGTLPYGVGTDTFERVRSDRWLITLIGAGHIPPYVAGLSSPASSVVVSATLDFLDAELKDDPSGIERMEQEVDAAGLAVATIEAAVAD